LLQLAENANPKTLYERLRRRRRRWSDIRAARKSAAGEL